MPLPIVAAAILPILKQAGTQVLADIIEKKKPGAGAVVEALGGALGIPNPTAGAIVEAYDHEPGPVVEAAQAVEANDTEYWRYLSSAQLGQQVLFEREDQRETFFSWGWRPALSWTLIWTWLQNTTLFPIVNALLGSNIALTPWEQVLAFSGIWLTIYGGGHTIKSVMAAKAGSAGK